MHGTGKLSSLFNFAKPPIDVNVVTGDVLQVLSSAMSLLRRCRVNAALTIQLFSQLFHFINMWLFNTLMLEPGLCTRHWGHRWKRRLGRIEMWAEKQGLELAADCHLARIIQVRADVIFLSLRQEEPIPELSPQTPVSDYSWSRRNQVADKIVSPSCFRSFLPSCPFSWYPLCHCFIY